MAKSKTKQRGFPLNPALDASKQKEFNQKVQTAKEKAGEGSAMPGVVYVSRLPWGFDEKPMRAFFSQFGTVTKLRVSRNKKTGNSRGYAYIQYAHDEVAKIVAETMNNYLMFEKLIKCKHITAVHPDTFKNADKKFRPYTAQDKAIKRHNHPKTTTTLKRNTAIARGRLRKKQNKLAELGIDYKLECLESGTSKNSDKDDTVQIKEEIFSDEEANKVTDTKKKKKRKSETVTESEKQVSSVDKTPKRMARTVEQDIVDVSDEDKDSRKKTLKRKSDKSRTVSDNDSEDLPVNRSVVKRKSPLQGKQLSKSGGKKQKLASKNKKQ